MRIKKIQDVVGAVGSMATEYTESSNAYYNAPYINNINEYSTEETFTGQYWINGKPIYRKVVEFGSFPSGGSKTVATGITNLSRIISLEYTWYDSTDGAYFTNARIDSASVMCKIQFKVNNNSLNVEGLGGTYWSTRTSQGVAIIEYTKTTD